MRDSGARTWHYLTCFDAETPVNIAWSCVVALGQGDPIINLKSWQRTAPFLVNLKSEVPREFELQAVRRAFQSRTGALIVDDEKVAVGTIDVAQLDINK
jgi:hypothetical protein